MTRNFIQTLPLNHRLKTVCALIENAPVIADIGCDHGKVSEYIVKNQLAQCLIVNDVSAPSLAKAKKLLEKYDADGSGNAPKLEYRCCDGAQLSALFPKPIHTVVIAGFGGRELLKIVEALKPETAVLEPQTAAKELRQGLYALGYIVDADVCVYDKRKFYDVLRAKKTYPPLKETLSAIALEYGHFYTLPNPYLKLRLQEDARKFGSYPPNLHHTERLHIIKEAILWQS